MQEACFTDGGMPGSIKEPGHAGSNNAADFGKPSDEVRADSVSTSKKYDMRRLAVVDGFSRAGQPATARGLPGLVAQSPLDFLWNETPLIAVSIWCCGVSARSRAVIG